jgi:hypothetical protein
MYVLSIIKFSLILVIFIGNIAIADYLPESTFYNENNGKRVLNIRNAPFYAKGDGVKDDTIAFLHAYDFVLSEIDKNGWTCANPASNTPSYVIYVPNGTYLVSDTIVYSGEPRWYSLREDKLDKAINSPKPGIAEAVVWIRIQGEDKSKTVIKLKDNAKGFEKSTAKPVISFGKTRFNNLPARNKISDLTIDVGNNNPGAVGLLFAGANNSFISDLDIKSTDLKGNSGILLPIPPTMGWHNNITIVGFDYGIRLATYHASHNSFEDIRLVNQNIAGIYQETGSVSFKDLFIKSNKSMAVIQENSKSLMTLSDSEFVCGNDCRVGVNSLGGQMLIRDTKILGYDQPINSISDKKNVSHIVSLIKRESGKSIEIDDALLHLVAKRPPVIFRSKNDSDWASPDDYTQEGKNSNSNNSLQLALNSGKPIVYLPKSEYIIDSSVYVPCGVKRISGLYSTIKTSKQFSGNSALVVNEECAEPITIEELDYIGKGAFIKHHSNRAIYLRSVTTRNRLYENNNTEKRKELFLSNVSGWGKSKYSCINEDVWARFVDTESPGPFDFYLDNCNLWVFGFKTEKLNTNFVLRNESSLKVLGGVVNQFDSSRKSGTITDLPLIDSMNSEFSVSLVSTGPNKKSHGFKIFASVRDGSKKYEIEWDRLPKRDARSRQIIVPLYQHVNSTGGGVKFIHDDSKS